MTALNLSSQELNNPTDTLCVPRADIEKCISIAWEKNQCLDREAVLLNAIQAQENQIVSLEEAYEAYKKKEAAEKEILENKIEIQRQKKKKNLIIGGLSGVAIGVISTLLVLH